jgi:hypothetical protein
MAFTQIEDIRLTPFSQQKFSGGINTSTPAPTIEDDEVVDQLNLMLDQGDNLVTRAGVSGAGGSSLWGTAIWGTSLWSNTSYAQRITSMLNFQNEAGFVGILYTTGTKLISRSLNGNLTDITGSLTLPDDVFWQWQIMNGIAIGVNKATSGSNPVKVVGPAPGTASALGGSPPRAKYVTLWNSRLWVVRADQPNQIQCSDLGNPEVWNTDGGAITSHGAIFDRDTDDGDIITGIHATKKRLFVFKRRSIHVAVMTSEPVTNLNFIHWDLYSDQIGCIAPYTIKTVANDVLFLSETGVASLAAVETVADFEESLLSRKVKDISLIGKNVEEISAGVFDDFTQYWLSIPQVASPVGRNITYVMDYRRIFENKIRWTTFDGGAWGTCFEKVRNGNSVEYLIGGQDEASFYVGTYKPLATDKIYSDGAKPYRKYFRTKAYDFMMPNIRKEYFEWTIIFMIRTASCAISVNYYFDDEQLNSNGNYSFNYSINVTGTLWDQAQWDSDAFDLASRPVRKVARKAFLFNDNGRKATSVSFDVLNAQLDQAFEVLNFSVYYLPLTADLTGID